MTTQTQQPNRPARCRPPRQPSWRPRKVASPLLITSDRNANTARWATTASFAVVGGRFDSRMELTLKTHEDLPCQITSRLASGHATGWRARRDACIDTRDNSATGLKRASYLGLLQIENPSVVDGGAYASTRGVLLRSAEAWAVHACRWTRLEAGGHVTRTHNPARRGMRRVRAVQVSV